MTFLVVPIYLGEKEPEHWRSKKIKINYLDVKKYSNCSLLSPCESTSAEV